MSNDAPVESETALDRLLRPAPGTPEAGELHNPRTTTAADHDDAPDTDAELARWKSLARKHEDRAKANADAVKELEKLRAATMTDIEKAVAETKSATRAEVLREVGATRAADYVRLAAAGRNVDIDALLEALDLARLVDDDGTPDVKAIGALVDRIVPAPVETSPVNPRVPTGHRGSVALNDDDNLLKDLKIALQI